MGETQLDHQVLQEIGARHVVHLVGDALQLSLAGRRIDDDITGDTFGTVAQIFDESVISQRGHTVSSVFIGDLGVLIADLELGNKICHLAHDLIAEDFGGVAVDDRCLVEGIGRNFREINVRYLDTLSVTLGVQDR